MSSVSDFPKPVQEILIFMMDGKFISQPYFGNIPVAEVIHDIRIGFEIYTNQDIKRPYYFLPDLISEKRRDIKIPPPPNQLEEFARHRDESNYYNIIRKNNSHLKSDLKLNEEDFNFLTNIIYEDLIVCAKARLFSKKRVPFFDDLFEVYKTQGFPCGWKGIEKNKGKLVIFSRKD